MILYDTAILKKKFAFVEAPGQLPSLPSPKSGAGTDDDD